MDIEQILNSNNEEAKKALFQFTLEDTNEVILLKFNLWARYFFPQYFKDEDAPFHKDINEGNLDAYRGNIDYFVDVAFRGAGKDVKTKLFIPFCILNDKCNFRRYFKVLAEDTTNSTQIVTDIYNILVNPRVIKMYPKTFEKTVYKREETMSSFTTAKGIKVIADTVGVEQRGAIAEAARPDFIWFNDFESRNTLRSYAKTKTIADNMEEARTGLEKGGCCVYTCNYISEQGNVHNLITEKLSDRKRVLIVPIADQEGNPTWKRYSKADIEQMKIDDDDFMGERMCKPDASKDIYFDREILDKMEVRQPIKEIAGFKIYREYNPSHRYAGGHDVAKGVGLDSSASVFIDFDTIPAQVVGTYACNTILPEAFGDECYNEGNHFGGCLLAIENNKFDQAVLKAKLLGAKLYRTLIANLLKVVQPSTNYVYGWETNSLTKSKMFSDFRKAVSDGLIALNDPDLIKEAKSYTRNDLIDREPDPRDVTNKTRHFDLLTAACIAWQMKDHAEPANPMDSFRKRGKTANKKPKNYAL
jgi:hypothetical protein